MGGDYGKCPHVCSRAWHDAYLKQLARLLRFEHCTWFTPDDNIVNYALRRWGQEMGRER
jgi:hypothetical protein